MNPDDNEPDAPAEESATAEKSASRLQVGWVKSSELGDDWRPSAHADKLRPISGGERS